MNSISHTANLPFQGRSIGAQRFLFPGLLIFSVCFYSYRFLVGMGSPLTTYYDSDAPAWLRVSKDVIWFAVLVIALVSSKPETWKFARRSWQEHRLFFRALSAFAALFGLTGVIHLFYYQSTMDTFLYWIRYPLEYIPIAFLMPLFIVRWRPIVPMLLGLGWLSVAFLIFEMLSGRQMGFYNRYGSIFGSPNDYGIFCALFIIGLLAHARKWSHWLLLMFMLCGLVSTLSRSAFAGLLAGICSLLYLHRVRIAALVGLVLLVITASLLVREFPDLLGFEQVQYALAHFDVDSSAISRLNELQVFHDRFGQFDLLPLLLGSDYFHIESWYLALMVRTGALGLILWIVIMGATVVRGWRHRHLSYVHAVATSGVIGICVASAFIPYPDTFPTNLYLWLAVGTIWMPLDRDGDDLSRVYRPNFPRICEDRLVLVHQQKSL
jgi:hypothetical protein